MGYNKDMKDKQTPQLAPQCPVCSTRQRERRRIRKDGSVHYRPTCQRCRIGVDKITRRTKTHADSISKRISRGKYGAKTRGLNWDLSREIYEKKIGCGCFYCGKCLLHETGVSLDRVDNSVGYEESNVVGCCGVCNWMKRAMTYEQFLRHIKRIHDYMGSKK